MGISASRITLAKSLLDSLHDARELRDYLVKNPNWRLQMDALAKDDTLYGEVRIKNLDPDLRLAIVDFLIERISARLRDLDVDVPPSSVNSVAA